MDRIINAGSLLGWASVLFMVTFKLISDPANYPQADITF